MLGIAEALTYLVRLGSHGVMCSRHKCFISKMGIAEALTYLVRLSSHGVVCSRHKCFISMLGVAEAFTYLVRLGSHGVMYSRHKCFISMLELPKPWMHSSRNSRVRWGSFAASVSLMDLMKMVLLAGIHRPVNVILSYFLKNLTESKTLGEKYLPVYSLLNCIIQRCEHQSRQFFINLCYSTWKASMRDGALLHATSIFFYMNILVIMTL